MSNRNFHIIQRLGFGFRPDENMPTSLKDWAYQQLELPAQSLGIPSYHQQKIQTWPDKYKKNLKQRVGGEIAYIKGRKRLRKDTSLSRNELKFEKKKLRQIHLPRYYDELRFAHQAVYNDDMLNQRLLHFWANHFTVGIFDAQSMNMDLYENAIQKHFANGYFAQMLYDVTRHPGMLIYLDNIVNIGEFSIEAKIAKENNRQAGLNDNLARELLELHSVSPSANYSEQDIRQIAKILAGWGIPLGSGKVKNIKNFMEFYIPRNAEPGEKHVFGKNYPAGKAALQLLTEDLAHHPHSAEFISWKLCRHFIADEPNKDDIAYIVNAWQQSNGHLKTIHQALIDRILLAEKPKFQWPITWLFTLARMSGAHIFAGWDDVYKKTQNIRGEIRPDNLFKEIGQSFWEDRQPNGFSDLSIDWISPEHLERRIRLAQLIISKRNPRFFAEDILKFNQFSQDTIDFVRDSNGYINEFVKFACSKEMLGVS